MAMVSRKIRSNHPKFGLKRNAFMKVTLSIIEYNDADTISLTRNNVKKMMRGITDYCANDKHVYYTPSRRKKTYLFSKKAWVLRDSTEKGVLVGDHCVPLKSIIDYIDEYKRKDTTNNFEIKNFLENHLEIVMITKEENDLLRSNGLNSEMPEEWDYFDNRYARYEKLGIELAEESKGNNLKKKTT